MRREDPHTVSWDMAGDVIGRNSPIIKTYRGGLRALRPDEAARPTKPRSSAGREIPEIDGGIKDGLVRVNCWCERKMIWLPIELVGVTTEVCGHRRCHPPRKEN